MTTKRPVILCLVNSAPYSRNYFEALAPALAERGYDVVFAVDSHFSDFAYADGRALADAHYFSDYCAKVMSSGEPIVVDSRHQWSQLFSDFDRFLTMKIPFPLAAGGALSYAQIPTLLERFFADIFAGSRPVAIVYEQVSNSFAVAANELAKRHGIPFFSLAPGRVAGRMEISATGALRDHETLGHIWERIKREGSDSEAREIADHHVRNVVDRIPDYMRAGGEGEVISRIGLRGKYVNREKLRHLRRTLRYRSTRPDDVKLAYQLGDPLRLSVAFFLRSLGRRFRASRVAKLYHDKPQTSRYFVYPLHFHPEASTSILAADFVDEMSVIKAIASRLPTDVVLAVKEHPSAIALQPTDFYKQLDAMPNVVLIGPNTNSKKLARDGLGVICVTSTLGFEAAILNKPVVCLGDVLFGYFPNVRMIQDYRELTEAIDWALGYEPIDPEAILTAMTAYVEFTEPGTFSFRQALDEPEAIDSLAGILAARLAALTSAVTSNLVADHAS